MDNEQNSNITADGETAQKPKKRRLTPWICRNDNCGKRAQSGCRSLCIACYTEQYPDEHRGQKKINQHQCDSTQRPQNLAILGSSSTNNNANVSLQRNSNLFHRSVSIPSMAYVAFLEQRIIDMETRSEQIEKRMETRISYLEELLRDRSSSMFQSQSFSSGLDNSMNLPMGLNFFPSSLQDYSIDLPRTNRTARTHADMLARSDSPHAGLDNSGVICYANAIFQALASMRHLTTLFDVPPPDTVTTYPLNHAFCSLLYSMVVGERNQNTVFNASNFITLFCERNVTFRNRQSK